MDNGTLPYPAMRPATDFAAHETPAVAAAASRTGRKPVREGGKRHAPALNALATCLLLLISLCSAQVALASPVNSVEKLRAVYSLDEGVAESDGRLIRRKLLRLLSRSDVRLFLKVIQTAEGGQPNLMVGGCRARSLKQHPALVLPMWCRYPVKGWGFSTASGNYQITLENWEKIAPFLGLRDFSEASQALAALELIRRGGGAARAYTTKGLVIKQRIQGGFLRLLRGDVNRALCMATWDWASSSCSILPANHKMVYARLADEIRKSRVSRLPARRGGNVERLQDARQKVKAPLASSARAGKAEPSQKKGSKANCFAGRGKE